MRTSSSFKFYIASGAFGAATNSNTIILLIFLDLTVLSLLGLHLLRHPIMIIVAVLAHLFSYCYPTSDLEYVVSNLFSRVQLLILAGPCNQTLLTSYC